MKELLLQTLREPLWDQKTLFTFIFQGAKMSQVCAWAKVLLNKFCSGTPCKEFEKLNKQKIRCKNFEIRIGCSYELNDKLLTLGNVHGTI